MKIEHLNNSYKFDNKVMIKGDRPYIGVILEINDIKYFAPLTSAKESRNKLNSQTTLKLFDKNSNFLGAIRFNNMIPCKESHLDLIEISKIKNIKYKKLLHEQYEIIKYKEVDRVLNKALKLYNKKINNPNDYVSKLCCDFKKLEEHLK